MRHLAEREVDSDGSPESCVSRREGEGDAPGFGLVDLDVEPSIVVPPSTVISLPRRSGRVDAGPYVGRDWRPERGQTIGSRGYAKSGTAPGPASTK